MNERATLAAENIDVNELNFKHQNETASELMTHKLVDSVIIQDDVINYRTEFLNSLESPRLPPYNFQLKFGSVIVMLQNNYQRHLFNDTRLAVKKLMNIVIKVAIFKRKY